MAQRMYADNVLSTRQDTQDTSTLPAADIRVQGDFAAHPLQAAIPLIDGRAAMLAMCVAFLRARRSIWVADWSIFADLKLIRGTDQRAGADDSDEQQALLARLRAAGLADDALALWQADQISLADVLGLAVRRGVEVRVLLWDPLDPWGIGHLGNNPAEQAKILARHQVNARLDKNCRSVLHLAQGLHQKCAVVDSEVAFVGGIDFTVEYSGDFDRWDISYHPFALKLRATERGVSPHPWHDAQVMFTGDAVRDVETNLRQRWDASSGRVQQRIQPLHEIARGLIGAIRSGHGDERGVQPHSSRPEATGHAGQNHGERQNPDPHQIQVVRTIPALTYRFAPSGIYGIARAYQQALRRAERFIYLESQYLWVEGLPKLNFTRLGWQSRKMRSLVRELAAAAERGIYIVLVLPDHPNVGRAVTDATIAWLRRHAPAAMAADRLHIYTLATSSPDDTGNMRYRPVYVHAKVAIVDDQWAMVGSANLNSRGMSHDAELNVAVSDTSFAEGLRRTLWTEHAGAPPPSDSAWPLGSPGNNGQTAIAPGDALAQHIYALVHTMPELAASQQARVSTDTTPTEQEALANALTDPLSGMRRLDQLAQENLQHLRAGEPLSGHLLPYLRSAEGADLGLNVERHRGLLDPLREVREGVTVPHYNRYI